MRRAGRRGSGDVGGFDLGPRSGRGNNYQGRPSSLLSQDAIAAPVVPEAAVAGARGRVVNGRCGLKMHGDAITDGDPQHGAHNVSGTAHDAANDKREEYHYGRADRRASDEVLPPCHPKLQWRVEPFGRVRRILAAAPLRAADAAQR
jgi:hypothetical protein